MPEEIGKAASTMFIDKVLSRFRIKTKVLLFILPFAVSISAVGLTGLYASGMLQGRMEISNSVLQSLTGFKELFGSMEKFLKTPTVEERDDLSARIGQQRASLNETFSQLDADAEGADKLQLAMAETDQLSGMIDSMWTEHEAETATRSAIDKHLRFLIGARMRIDQESSQLERSVQKDESTATAMLREADRLMKGADFLAAMGADYAKLKTPDEKTALVNDRIVNLGKMHGLLVSALPPTAKSTGETLAATIADLKTAAALPASDDSAAQIGRLVSRFRQMSVYIQLAATDKMRNATRIFMELDARISKTASILGDIRRIVSGTYSLQIVMSEFLARADAENVARLKKEIKGMSENIEVLSQGASDPALFEKVAAPLRPMLAALQTDAEALVEAGVRRNGAYAAAGQKIDSVWASLVEFTEQQKSTAGTERQQANSISVFATVTGLLLAIVGGIALVLTLQRPIGQITAAMRRIADGMLDTGISGEARYDEIGDMARALGVFKENALSKIQVETRSEEQRALAEAERARNDAEKQDLDARIEQAVSELAAGLARLADGDVSRTIDTPFISSLERLRTDFNLSLSRLQETMRQIRENVHAIQSNGNQMAQSAEDLSKRTEKQAASLEETAAAVDEITVTVRSSAERAQEAERLVQATKRSADDSAMVVGNAIDAMSRIEGASHEIEQIIDVIDEIAFQTNLLALNAGIEAARAGDAGKGFAVVAQEVRELAQRSASAAHQIKGLINTSTKEVSTGSRYVQETGSVLALISSQIVTISQHVEMIATASKDQSAALQDVNGSVNEMDQMTQRNAAMVEETTAASRELANEADGLMQLVSRFRTETDNRRRAPMRAA